MLEDKYIGLILAVTSTIAIGSSYVITKRGLQHASERHGFDGDGHQYLKSPIWWAGLLTMGVGEVSNFAAYAFAPAILVTPLGALSVLTGAVLGAYFLKEELGILGKLGCAICLLGSVIIASHAPPDKDIETVDEILDYAIKFRKYSPVTGAKIGFSTYIYSFLGILHLRHNLFRSNDLQNRAQIWQAKPIVLYIHMRNCWLGFGHVR